MSVALGAGAAEAAETPKSVLERAFSILDCFGPDDADLSLADLSRRTGLPKSTVHRLAATLVAWRGLERVDERFRLGMRLFELGELVPHQRELRDAALPFMEDLYEATHETVHLGVLDGTDVVYLAKVNGHRRLSAPSRIGGRMPAYCTGLGKALLAHSGPDLVEAIIGRGLRPRTPYTITVPSVLRTALAEVLAQGVAFDREENTLGVACAAAPVFMGGGRPVAALSVSAPTRHYEPEQLAAAVRTGARGLSRALSTRAF
jgi:DNA-binding IclR family transcriptional regulator